MNNETGQRLTEAIWALTNELALQRQQAEQGPSQHRAAFLIPGALVTVNNPRSEWYGMTGTITHTSHGVTTVRFPGNNTQPIANQHLTKAEQS